MSERLETMRSIKWRYIITLSFPVLSFISDYNKNLHSLKERMTVDISSNYYYIIFSSTSPYSQCTDKQYPIFYFCCFSSLI